MDLRKLSFWTHFILFFVYTACAKKSNSEVKLSRAVTLEAKKNIQYDTSTVKGINKNNSNTQELTLFLREHTSPLSLNDLKKLDNNVDYKYPLLLNNRENAQERGDTIYYFSKKFNYKIGFSKTDLIRTGHYNLYLFDEEQKIFRKAETSGLESEETYDCFKPFDNGNGFVQFAYRLGYSMNIKIYTLSNGKYTEAKQLKSEIARLHSVCVAENGSSFVVVTYNKDNIFNIEKYSISGSKLFSRKLQNIDILPSSLYVSNDGNHISYYYRSILNGNQIESRYAILNSRGEPILNIPVFHIGNFPATDIKYKNIDYLIVEGHKVYIFDLTQRKLVREIGGDNNNAKAYRVYFQNNKIYILFVEYRFLNNRKVQDKKYIQIFDLETGLKTSTIILPFSGEVSLYLHGSEFYLKHEDIEMKNNIFKLKI
ncbi:MAG: hypothetical protein IPN13_07120 [Bacteroidetes bacterium]|nr:hypothetical protein [Candidatus Vicinibacter affinis]MBK8873688.1 hypothetical protein [Bacteroidota bacterium]MBK6572516.1 hypothetical protein [Candidatus Vicinibacter affinis]MBK7304301.1 hypothetical protein [Candidatus Vicinibacter affinis]MBK7798904.1 hypothetical protein [Candidatus Vicinibacter affinis]